MSNPRSKGSKDSRIQDDRIRERAYHAWEAEGCPDGCADRHWLQAETELRQSADSAGSGQSDAPGVAGRSRRRV